MSAAYAQQALSLLNELSGMKETPEIKMMAAFTHIARSGDPHVQLSVGLLTPNPPTKGLPPALALFVCGYMVAVQTDASKALIGVVCEGSMEVAEGLN